MNKSRMMRWIGHVAYNKGNRNAYRILVGNPERKRPLGKSRRRWLDDIKIDLREIGEMIWTRLIRLWIGTSGGLL
jgi:hypothetical protein